MSFKETTLEEIPQRAPWIPSSKLVIDHSYLLAIYSQMWWRMCGKWWWWASHGGEPPWELWKLLSLLVWGRRWRWLLLCVSSFGGLFLVSREGLKWCINRLGNLGHDLGMKGPKCPSEMAWKLTFRWADNGRSLPSSLSGGDQLGGEDLCLWC